MSNGFVFRVDRRLPPGVIEVRAPNGRVLGRIMNCYESFTGIPRVDELVDAICSTPHQEFTMDRTNTARVDAPRGAATLDAAPPALERIAERLRGIRSDLSDAVSRMRDANQRAHGPAPESATGRPSKASSTGTLDAIEEHLADIDDLLNVQREQLDRLERIS